MLVLLAACITDVRVVSIPAVAPHLTLAGVSKQQTRQMQERGPGFTLEGLEAGSEPCGSLPCPVNLDEQML